MERGAEPRKKCPIGVEWTEFPANSTKTITAPAGLTERGPSLVVISLKENQELNNSEVAWMEVKCAWVGDMEISCQTVPTNN